MNRMLLTLLLISFSNVFGYIQITFKYFIDEKTFHELKLLSRIEEKRRLKEAVEFNDHKIDDFYFKFILKKYNENTILINVFVYKRYKCFWKLIAEPSILNIVGTKSEFLTGQLNWFCHRDKNFPLITIETKEVDLI